MTDKFSIEDDAAVVALARKIIETAGESGPLVAVHRYYPTRGAAFEAGFWTCCGWISAISCAIVLGCAIEWVLS